MKKIKKRIAAIAVILPLIVMTFFVQPALSAKSLEFKIYRTDAEHVDKTVGTITAMNTQYGLLLKPNLTDLKPGISGFHVHQKPNCNAAEKDGKVVLGLAAGGHLDPAKTTVHLGPYGTGHLGDLPPLYVSADGTATLPVLAPRLKVADLAQRSLMIHAGGDNFSDSPAPLGGGGARVACGVVGS